MARRLTPRGRDRRRQLMAFAAERFAEHGYHSTSVAEIVEGVGVGKGVFYWYFRSKEELFLEILGDAQTDLRRRQHQALASVDDPVARIEAGIAASMRWLADHRGLMTLLQFAATEERFAPALRRGQDVAVGDVARHVKEAMASGRVAASDPLVVSHAILGVINQLARVFVLGRHEAPEEVAAAAVEFCRHGLLGVGPPGAR